jgi:restriction endonuclease
LPTTKESVLATLGSSITPMMARDVYQIMQDQKLPTKTIVALLAIAGAGTQNYEPAGPAKFATLISEHENLLGVNKHTKEVYDYREQVDQVIDQAKKLGITENEMRNALSAKMRQEGKTAALGKWLNRLHTRYAR